MKNYLGEIIFESRRKNNLTQEEYAARFSVSGPAIFKFEKGYVHPSLELWLKMAADAQISERRAVLLWVKSKLPVQFQEFVELQAAAAADAGSDSKAKSSKADYSKVSSREQMRETVAKDQTLPKGLRELLEDDELWALYKPTGREVNQLRDLLGPLGRGNKNAFREALCLIREFQAS